MFFNKPKPTSFITYTFTDKTSLNLTVSSEAKHASTTHRIYGADVRTKTFKFDMLPIAFQNFIKDLTEQDQKNIFTFKLPPELREGEDVIVSRTSNFIDDDETVALGFSIKAKDDKTLLTFVQKLKDAHPLINKHLNDKLLDKVEKLEMHYEDTWKQVSHVSSNNIIYF